jgi:hypothetical protein
MPVFLSTVRKGKLTVFITGADKKCSCDYKTGGPTLPLDRSPRAGPPNALSLRKTLSLLNQFTEIPVKLPVVLALVVDFTRNPTVPIEGACEFKVITGVFPPFQKT